MKFIIVYNNTKNILIILLNFLGGLILKKHKIIMLIVSMVVVVAVLAGCTSSNSPSTEGLTQSNVILAVESFQNGSITVNGTKVEADSEFNEAFEQGEEITLVATPDDGYIFNEWSFDEKASVETTLVITEDTVIKPDFVSDPGTGQEGEEDGEDGEDEENGDEEDGENGDDEEDGWVNPELDPEEAKINLLAPTSVETLITLNDANNIEEIVLELVEENKVLAEDDYEIEYGEDNKTLRILSNVFQDEALNLEVDDKLEFRIIFNKGNDLTFTVIVTEETIEDYEVDPGEVTVGNDLEFIITLKEGQSFKPGALNSSHVSLGGAFAGLEVEVEKVYDDGEGFPSSSNKARINLIGTLEESAGYGYIGVSASRIESEIPLIVEVNVID